MIRLGLRLAVSGGREALTRLVILAAAVGIGAGLLLSVISAVNAVGVQNDRYAWLDTGTPRSLIEAGTFIEAIEERQGLKVACLEEIAWRNGWIGDAEIRAAGDALGKSPYADYLRELTKSPHRR